MSVSSRARAVKAYSYDAFPVGPGDLDLRGDGSAPLTVLGPILDQLHLAPASLASYGPVSGLPTLRESIADLVGVRAEDVIITAGASEALHLAFLCAGEPGQPIHLPQPAFPGFDQLATLTGLRPQHYPVPGDLTGLLARAGADPVLICTPHNPTGARVVGTQLGSRLAGFTIWDLSHTSLRADELAGHMAGLTDTDICVVSLSKLLRLPGARVGCLISRSRPVIAAALAAKTHLSMSTSTPSQHLAHQVLTDPGTGPELAARRRALDALRDHLRAAVGSSRELSADPAVAGTHLLVHSRTSADPYQVLRHAGIVGLPGEVFNCPTPAVRLCTAQPEHVITVAARIVRAL